MKIVLPIGGVVSKWVDVVVAVLLVEGGLGLCISVSAAILVMIQEV